MTAETILYIIIAGVISFALAVFMYAYKTKYTGKLRWLFGSLRFVTLFSLLLLLINPKFKSNTYTIEKPELVVLIDNSSSMMELQQEDAVRNALSMIEDNIDLQDKFDVSYFGFGNDFKTLDSLSLSEKRTHIEKAISTADELFKEQTAPTILITDGNQTLGKDYEFASQSFSNNIYPLIAGDTTLYVDLKLEQLNTNRYSFLKNKFPVEAVVVYSGSTPVNSRFIITKNGNTVYSKNLSFNKTENTQNITTTIEATRVGLQRYRARIVPLDEEKNKVNNSKAFAVEVIDQATNVLIVSNVLHPDMGALKKAIETNEQRKVFFKKPAEAVGTLNDYQLVILHQPDRSFSGVYQEIDRFKKNTLTISGMQTDWSFLNTAQSNFRKEASNESETVNGRLNPNYGAYALDDIGFDDFPPLTTEFGALTVEVPHETLLEQSINGFSTGTPMIATTEVNGKRDAIWDGEGVWRWRAQSYLAESSFQDFDAFVGNMVQYLASNKRRSRLEVASESFYYNNNPLLISAQYFDNNFVFDPRAQLNISVLNSETKETTTFPMLLKNNFFEVDLNSLPAGSYSYTISVVDEGVARSGSFSLLDFNVEQQFLNANVTKLQRVATHTGGEAFFIASTDGLLTSLVANESYQAIQKTDQKVVPLIDWKYLLGLIALVLALEWVIRKYNGLI